MGYTGCMAKSAPNQLKDTVIKESVTAVLKPAGFRKASTWFRRRHGQTLQAVNLQGSVTSRNESLFYVNVAVRFDELCVHLGKDTSDDRAKIYGHTTETLGGRLEKFLDDTPAQWILTVPGPADGYERRRPTDVPSNEVPVVLKQRFETLLSELELLDSVAAFRDHRWFADRATTEAHAVTHYLLGDYAAVNQALDDLQAKARVGLASANEVQRTLRMLSSAHSGSSNSASSPWHRSTIRPARFPSRHELDRWH